MNEIKLPPLPYPQIPGNDYTAKDMHDYARAAIEADRQARGEPVYAFRRKGLADFATCTKERFDELSDNQLFDTRIFYTTPQPPQIPEGYRLQPLSEFDAMMDTRTIPEGYKLMPIEPTLSMIAAARLHHEGEAYLPVSLYKAMLEAAPEVKP